MPPSRRSTPQRIGSSYLFNPVRVADGGPLFPGSVGDIFWGGITGPRYFLDPSQKLVGIVFVQGPSVRAAYHAELPSVVYGALATGGK